MSAPLNEFGQYVPYLTVVPGPYTASSSSSGGGDSMNYSGSGSPEGVKTADVSLGTVTAFYWDYTNKRLYVKDTGAGNTGWREIIA